MLKVITGNILSAEEQYIAHQCNCVTTTSAGLAKIIFTKWTHAECYYIRWAPDKPGTIEVRGDGKYHGRLIINMFAQYNPGKPPSADDPLDGFQARKKYFIMCLNEIKKLNPVSIAFPLYIGAGMAGGDHNFYKSALTKFADSNINVVLYDLPPKQTIQ